MHLVFKIERELFSFKIDMTVRGKDFNDVKIELTLVILFSIYFSTFLGLRK